METLIGHFTYRAARADDARRIVEILSDPPPPETLAIAGSVSSALAAEMMLFDVGLSVSLATTTVVEDQGAVVGFMDTQTGRTARPSEAFVLARLAPAILLRFGPAVLLRAVRWMRVTGRVQFERDPSALHIAELDVAATHRGRGIGAALLDVAEQQARAAGLPRMTLTTKITNPARRLYERQGFQVIASRTDAEWERWSASPGRVLMVKTLT